MDDPTDRTASADTAPTPAQGGVAGGTYAPGDQSAAAQRSKFRHDQRDSDGNASDHGTDETGEPPI